MKLLRSGLIALFCASPALGDVPLLVEAVTVTRTTQDRSITQTGEIVARDTLVASFAAGGRVASVEVDKGDVVTIGMPLARMESVQQEQALRAAKAGVASAAANHDQAVDDYERQEKLLERGAVTKKSRDAARDNLSVAKGTLAQAQSDMELAQKALSDTVLVAVSDATVTDRTIEPGQVVGAAQPVLELAIGGELDAVFEISEGLLTLGGTVSEVALSSIDPPVKHYSGHLREISPLVSQHTGTVTVTVGVIGHPDGVTYGDAVSGTVRLGQEPVIVLPYTAMSATAQGPAVWVVEPETMIVSLQPITVERFETGRIIVADGVEDGVIVVTRGAQLLYPGRKVRITGDNT